jgi:hypothetical protein
LGEIGTPILIRVQLEATRRYQEPIVSNAASGRE